MEDRSSVGISIKNVPVRLNEANIENDTIEECKKSLFGNTSSDINAQTSRVTQNCEASQKITAFDASSERSRDLNYADSGLLNGCSEILHNDLNGLHISVNGVDGYELFDDVNHVCDCPVEYARTKQSDSNTETAPKQSESSAPSQIACPDLDKPVNVENTSPGGLLTCSDECDISYVGYDSEHQMPDIIRLIQKDLSEPYSIYTYRYFIHNWPKLCFLALHKDQCVGAIVCKLDLHKKHSRRGYIAMLAVDEKYRKRKIGSNLVLKAIDAMAEDNADEVVLETEITNKPALKLYENLGFVRDKRLFRYYLNGVDALRLKLWLR